MSWNVMGRDFRQAASGERGAGADACSSMGHGPQIQVGSTRGHAEGQEGNRWRGRADGQEGGRWCWASSPVKC